MSRKSSKLVDVLEEVIRSDPNGCVTCIEEDE
jgi:hypothetical protein